MSRDVLIFQLAQMTCEVKVPPAVTELVGGGGIETKTQGPQEAVHVPFSGLLSRQLQASTTPSPSDGPGSTYPVKKWELDTFEPISSR